TPMSCVRCRAPPLPRGRGALLAVFWTPASTAAFQRPTLYPRKASIAGAWRHEAYRGSPYSPFRTSPLLSPVDGAPALGIAPAASHPAVQSSAAHAESRD